MTPQSGRHYWVDRLSPWFIHIYGPIGIRWYGLAYLAGVLIAAAIVARMVRAGRLPIERKDVGDLAAWAMIGILVGGRLGYCLIYNLHGVLRNPLEIFAVWHGGMASHG